MQKDPGFDVYKALILPLNAKNQLFIQDRQGHKKPDWGYFGGSIEGEETPLQAVQREAQEELSLDIQDADLQFLGTSTTDWYGKKTMRYMFIYRTEQEVFDVREGRGGVWLSFDEVRQRMDDKDRFDDVVALIKQL